MSPDPATDPAGQGGGRSPSSEAVKQELERVLASPDFIASDRLKKFLRFVVEAALAGRADRLHGYPIALEVLGRDASFDPQADPVVRLEAGRGSRVPLCQVLPAPGPLLKDGWGRRGGACRR